MINTPYGSLPELGDEYWNLNPVLQGMIGDLTGRLSEENLGDIRDIYDAVEGAASANDALMTAVAANPASSFSGELNQTYVPRGYLVVSVKDAGATGNGTTDDTVAIQSAFTGGNRKVYFDPGTYRIAGEAIQIFANTIIEFHPQAIVLNDRTTGPDVFLNGEIGNTTFATGYTGAGNIHVIGNGATIDNGPRAARNTHTEAFAFGHAENISIDGLKFLNNYASHFIELNSIRKGSITNCLFRDYNNGGFTDRECINLDSATSTGFPQFGAYDNSPSTDILISGNRFDTVPAGVGNHSSTANWLSRIRIIDNVFNNIGEHAIRTTYWQDSVIRGNVINNTGTRAIWADKLVNSVVSDNTIRTPSTTETGNCAIQVGGTESDGVVVSNNAIIMTNIAFGIRLFAGTNHRVTGNKITGWTSQPVQSSINLSQVDNVFRVSLATDEAIGIDVPGQKQGLVIISANSASEATARGMWWIRANSGEEVAPTVVSSIGTTTASTGVLTGSTGLAGTTTISVWNGKLYIENRRSVATGYNVQFVTS